MFLTILLSVRVVSGTASMPLFIISTSQTYFSRGNKKTVCNYICPVSESVGVSTSCKIKSGGQNWSNPTRELTCNLPAECDIDALTAEAADFLSRIGSSKRVLK